MMSGLWNRVHFDHIISVNGIINIKALSSKEYSESSRKKREDTKKGKQHSKQPKKTARKTRAYRKVK